MTMAGLLLGLIGLLRSFMQPETGVRPAFARVAGQATTAMFSKWSCRQRPGDDVVEAQLAHRPLGAAVLAA